MNWQPIETAPKDGTVIDLWQKEYWSRFKHQDGRPYDGGEWIKAKRVTDCRWTEQGITFLGEEKPGWMPGWATGSPLPPWRIFDEGVITHWCEITPPTTPNGN